MQNILKKRPWVRITFVIIALAAATAIAVDDMVHRVPA